MGAREREERGLALVGSALVQARLYYTGPLHHVFGCITLRPCTALSLIVFLVLAAYGAAAADPLSIWFVPSFVRGLLQGRTSSQMIPLATAAMTTAPLMVVL